MKKITFPESFSKTPHKVIPGATQWSYPKDSKTQISVVGGGFGLHGNGVTSFEMWDFDEDHPQSYLSTDEINAHLKKKYEQQEAQ